MALRQLYPRSQQTPPGAPGDPAKVDIIAVHGLNPRSKADAAHAWDTWRTPAGHQGHLWLRDDLPQHVPNARIFLYEYNATAVYGGDKGTFTDKANELLEAIRVERDEIELRPILFLGHSLGGLLIKQALINAHNTPSLAFFATPHNGGDWKLLSLGSMASKIAVFTGFQQGDDVLETLKSGSIFSDIMHELWRQQLMRYDIISFWGARDQIVPRESARLGMPGDRENVVKLNADHSSVCKFGSSQTDQDNFKLVRANIKDLYKNALKKSGHSGAEPTYSGWNGQQQPGFASIPTAPVSNPTTPQPPIPAVFPPPPPPRPSAGATPDSSPAQPVTGFIYRPTGPHPQSAAVADHKNANRWDQARQLEQRIFEEHQRTLDVTHPTTLDAAYDIAVTHFNLSFVAEASRWADWTATTAASALSAKHAVVLKTNRLRGEILIARGCFAEAETMIGGVFIDQEDRLGADHLDTLETAYALGLACHTLGRSKDAQTRMEDRLAALKRVLGETHILVASAVLDLVGVTITQIASDSYMLPHRRAEAQRLEKLVGGLFDRLRVSAGPHNRITIRALQYCGRLKMLQGEMTAAADMLRRALSYAEEALGPDHPDTMTLVRTMGTLCDKRDGDMGTCAPSAWPWFERYAKWAESRLGLAVPETKWALFTLGMSYAKNKNHTDAERCFERLVRAYEGDSSKQATLAQTWYQLMCQRNQPRTRKRMIGKENAGDLAGLFSKLGFLTD